MGVTHYYRGCVTFYKMRWYCVGLSLIIFNLLLVRLNVWRNVLRTTRVCVVLVIRVSHDHWSRRGQFPGGNFERRTSHMLSVSISFHLLKGIHIGVSIWHICIVNDVMNALVRVFGKFVMFEMIIFSFYFSRLYMLHVMEESGNWETLYWT